MDPSVVLSVFEDRYARDVRQEEGRWSELVDAIAGAPEVPTKEQCRMLKLARFGDQRTDKGSLRHDANVLEVCGIEADYDAGKVSLGAARDMLTKYDILAAGYESWSCTPEKPRWRLLAPFAQPHAPADRERYVEVLNGMLGGILAPESDVLSQVYYFGKPVGEERKSVSIEGASRCIDELPTAELDALRLPLRAPAGPPPLHRTTNAKSKAVASNEALLDELLAGEDVHGNALRLVGRWISGGLSDEEITVIMTPLAQKVANVRGPERAGALLNGELQRMLTGARSKGRASRRRRFTDLGNAERLRERHGENLGFCPQAKKWLYWDSERWLWDEDGEICRRAAETVRAIYPEIQHIKDEDKRKALAAHAAKSEARPRIVNMIKSAESLERMPLPISCLDADKMLLGIIDGTLDLATVQFRAAERQDYITKRANVEFESEAQCPRWLKFLEEIFAGDQDLIAFIQRVVGYCLTGETSEQCLFVLHGHGANGKSVFLRVVHALMGDYAMETLPATLMETRRGSTATIDVARLRGARLVSASEPDEGCILAEGVVKQLTGQDKVTCRFLYQEFFEYEPQFKILLVTNHKPIVKGDDHAIWRRLHLIPFEVTIPQHQQDKTLADKLIAGELPGILNWALRGLAAWLERGISPPESVLSATKEYRDEMDILGDWFNECCTMDPQIPHTPTATLYASYNAYCKAGNLTPLTNKAFGRKLADRGFESKKGTGGTRGFRGIGVKACRKPPTHTASLLAWKS